MGQADLLPQRFGDGQVRGKFAQRDIDDACEGWRPESGLSVMSMMPVRGGGQSQG